MTVRDVVVAAVAIAVAIGVRVASGRILDRIRSREAATRPPEPRNEPDGTVEAGD
jgi:hypothetical protein